MGWLLDLLLTLLSGIRCAMHISLAAVVVQHSCAAMPAPGRRQPSLLLHTNRAGRPHPWSLLSLRACRSASPGCLSTHLMHEWKLLRFHACNNLMPGALNTLVPITTSPA
jgi:hypothetical protein